MLGAWVERADAAAAFVQAREGKRVALLDTKCDRIWGDRTCAIRLVVQVIERTIDKRGQRLLEPDIELQGWWTSLDAPQQHIIDLYKHHGMHEQFHSEIKTDLDLERLPSGKFDTNDCVLALGGFAYNCLRLLGQVGLSGEMTPVRHPAHRRRLKTVLQEIMYRAAKVIAHARTWALDFGQGWSLHAVVFSRVQQRLWGSAVT